MGVRGRAPDAPGATIDAPRGEGPGAVIGPHRLPEWTGEGGLGVDFPAEQTQPVRRQEALEVLKPGRFAASPPSATRFLLHRLPVVGRRRRLLLLCRCALPGPLPVPPNSRFHGRVVGDAIQPVPTMPHGRSR
jgi:hypothetical protein